jgi:hypothetical protein
MPVVSATAAFANYTDQGRKQEAAMTAAVLQAYAEGITDPDAIKQRIAAALAALNS